MVSADKSYDDSIVAPQVSEVETLSNDVTPARHIPPEPPPQQLSEGDSEGSQLEEAIEGANPGCPIQERDKNNHLIGLNLHKNNLCIDLWPLSTTCSHKTAI